AAELALQAAANESATPEARGRALIFAANLYTKASQFEARTKLLVSIAENYPRINSDHFLDEEFDETKDSPSPEQRLSLAKYFISKERGYPARRFLLPIKGKLDADGLMLLARANYLSANNDDAAKLLAQLAAKNNPENVRRDACILRARLFLKQGAQSKAIVHAGSCIANYPDSEGDALEIIAKAYSIKDDEGLRLKTIMRLTERAPSHPGNDVNFLLVGRFYLVGGSKDRAAEAFKAIETYFPDSASGAEAGFWRARLALETGDSETAAELFSRIQRRFPYSYFNFRCGQYLAQMGMPDNSRPAAPPLNALLPISNTHLIAGNALRHLNLFDLADVEYKAAASVSQDDAAIGIAQNQRDSGDLMNSVKTLEQRILAQPAFYARVMSDPSLTALLFPRLYEDILEAEGAKYQLDPIWLLSLIRQESRFNPLARSTSNAMGLMQIIPSTGNWIAEKIGVSRFQLSSLFEPETNIKFGVWYFDYLLKRFSGDYTLAVAAYNGGPGNVSRWLEKYGNNDIDLFIERIPRDETRDYTKKVQHNYFVYSQLLHPASNTNNQ
ncbi:MAG: transglycosylase SLT domain-containing protein, partial [bacterium]